MIELCLGERKRIVDPQASPPEHDDQPAQAVAVGTVAGSAHHGDDLLDRWWVGGVAKALCCAAGGRRGGRAK